jgi:endoglucanase
MKKIENLAGVTSVTKTPEYNQLLKYWNNESAKPTVDFAKKALMQTAKNFKMKNLTIRYDVIDAMFRQVQTTDTKKYKNHSLPGKVFATEYDLGQNGFAYLDKDVANYDGTKFTKWNKGGMMRNDGVDIELCTDAMTNGFHVAFIEDGEWLQYTVEVKSKTTFDVAIRCTSVASGGKLYLEDENGRISETITIPSSGGINNWKTVTLKNVILKQGTNKVKVRFEKGNFNLNFLEFKKAKK